MNLNQAKQKLSEIKIIYDKDKAETTEIDRQIKEIDENKNQVSGSLSALEIQNESSRKEIENLKIRFSSVEQKTAFIQENITRINSEIAVLELEEADIRQRKASLSSEVEDKNAQIEKLRSDIHKAKNQIADCNTKICLLYTSFNHHCHNGYRLYYSIQND